MRQFHCYPCAALLAVCIFPAIAHGQARDSVPSTRYFNAFTLIYEGDYRDALEIYLDEGKSGIKSAQSRWIDSICYHTMTGECYYQMGNLAEALKHYTRALELQVAFADWMIRVQFPPGIQPASAGGRISVPWGATKNASRVGQFSEAYMMGQGRINNDDVVKRGGVVQQAILMPVNVKEIVRATCLAIRRRRELLGPTCKYDPLTRNVLASLTRRPGPANHWSQAWIEVQLGAAHASMGNTQQAASLLEHSVLAAGEFEHPLTSTAFLELGRLALEAGDYQAAARLFEEATYSAANFSDLGTLEEAFRLGQMNHLVSGAKGPYPPLAAALKWADRKSFRQLQASLATLAAENAAVLGNTQAASALLKEAGLAIGRRDMGRGAIGARANFAAALVAFQQGKLADGEQMLSSVWKYQQSGSFWLLHIGLVDSAVIGRATAGISDRIALTLYDAVLRDPLPTDWVSSPMESITVLTTPHPLPYEHWFEVATKRTQDRELAVDIADRARRHRYFYTLPLGGRLLALRWILEGPDELLDKQQMLQRQDLLARFPKYDTLTQRVKQLHAELAKLPSVPDAEADAKKQAAILEELGVAGAAQELILREIAVRREPADMVFPPLRRMKDLQRSLPEGRLLLVFFNTSRGMYGFLFSKEKYTSWPIHTMGQIRKQLPLVLRDLGNFEQNYQLGQIEISGESWKKNAAKLRDMIFDKSNVELRGKFDELVIVPDGILWYVPWETLPVGDDDAPLLSRTKIRYAPTVGLSVPYSSKPLASRNVGVVVGKLFPQDQPEVGQAAFEQFRKSVPEALALAEMPPAATAIYRRMFDELVVLDDIEPTAGVYDWSPAQLDRGKPGGTLAAWNALPWGGPDAVMLPGFHSFAENGLKPKKGLADGSDLFLPIMGLMSSGVRTVLLSRWRTGGQISYDLMREFVQELPHTRPTDAWQRAMLLAQENDLDSDLEPRLKKFTATAEAPKAAHPFFWSGYMLADMGPPSEKPEPGAAVAPQAADLEEKEDEAADLDGDAKQGEAKLKAKPVDNARVKKEAKR